MFNRILVPIDLTDKNTGALNLACELADHAGGEVTMLHVIETIDVPVEELGNFYGNLEDKAAHRMHALAEPHRTAGVRVKHQICFGKRAPEIVSYAHEHDVDLTIMSSHRLDPEHPTESWMNISHQVALLAPNSVLLLK